jgi:hypothetical protein
MKTILLIIMALVATITSQAQIKKGKVTETYKVNGNCGMCKMKIEKAANKSKECKAAWNEESHLLTITYNKKKLMPMLY